MSQSLKPKHLFLVPFFIVNLLERNKLPLSAVKDLVKLREVASPEDLVLTLLLNENPQNVFGVNTPTSGPQRNWCASPEAFAVYSQLVDLKPMHQQGLEERLFSETNLEARYPHEFDIRDLDEDTFLIIIYPGHYGGADTVRNQFKLLHAYLKQLYAYGTFDTVARDPLFAQYVSQL